MSILSSGASQSSQQFRLLADSSDVKDAVKLRGGAGREGRLKLLAGGGGGLQHWLESGGGRGGEDRLELLCSRRHMLEGGGRANLPSGGGV